ncbi:hypothetical protein HDU76_007752 [Blyttiomyces sp. JEL0837]|nr:hypothetical protein HDU76_007752 [Blyttiomyces sp. JEL0837]
MPKASDYQVPIVSDGWLGNRGLSVKELFRTKTGPNEILSIAERLYLLKKYEEALTLSMQWLEENKNMKQPFQNHEICDLAARSAMKLGKLSEARALVTEDTSVNDIGYQCLKAQVLAANGLVDDAIQSFKRYLELRPTDYKVWKEISKMLLENKALCQAKEEQDVLTYWAMKSLKLSFRQISRSRRDWTSVSYVNEEVELKGMKELIVNLEAGSGGISNEEEAVERLGKLVSVESAQWLASQLDLNSSDQFDDNADEKEDARNL